MVISIHADNDKFKEGTIATASQRTEHAQGTATEDNENRVRHVNCKNIHAKHTARYIVICNAIFLIIIRCLYKKKIRV